MIVKCPECGKKGKLDDEYEGRTVSCPECAVTFVATAVPDSKKQTKWYYAVGEEKKGPVDQATFDSLVGDGTITPKTLIWCKGMDNWSPLGESRLSPASADAGFMVCNECKNSFSPDKMMTHEGMTVCEMCKLDLLHKKQEEAESEELVAEEDSEFVTGGLGGRFMAKIIDFIFMLAMGGMVEGLSRRLFPASFYEGPVNKVFIITLTINMLLGIFYVVWFVGKFAATPGKMVARLKIVNSDGSKLGYGQAFGRYCGEFVVEFLTLSLGYFFAFFDKKRRTLHDRLCRTWVVRA